MSELVAHATIREVTGEAKTVNGEQTMLYTVQAEGGPFTTWKEDIAVSAHALIGQPATITYVVQENHRNGRTYKNKYVQQVSAGAVGAPSGGAAFPSLPPTTAPGSGLTESSTPQALAGNGSTSIPNGGDLVGQRMTRSASIEHSLRLYALVGAEERAALKAANAEVQFLNAVMSAYANYIWRGDKLPDPMYQTPPVAAPLPTNALDNSPTPDDDIPF